MANRLKPLQSGTLRQVGDIEVRTLGEDSAGSPLTTYVLWAKDIRFDFADWRVTENMPAKQVETSVLTYITMRWRPGITSQMRIKHIAEYGSPQLVDYYDIQGVVRDPSLRTTLQLACLKRDAAGFRTGTIP